MLLGKALIVNDLHLSQARVQTWLVRHVLWCSYGSCVCGWCVLIWLPVLLLVECHWENTSRGELFILAIDSSLIW